MAGGARRRGHERLDEDDIRVRPGRGSRPRTRTRPAYEDAVDAFVVAVDRGRYTCRVGGVGAVDGPDVVAVRGGDVRRRPVVVGDQVALVGDVSGTVDTLARVVRIAERRSLLRRTPDDTDPVERPVVANAELLVVVVALADPAPHSRLIDRCLVAAYDGGLTPLLCLTKTDLAPADALVDSYGPLGVPIVQSGRGDGGTGVAELTERLRGRVSVVFGHSGVGKSTLVNQLVPGTGREVGSVNAVTGRGRHTSSSAVAVPLPSGGWVIDTPGIRSFGLGAVSDERVLAAFPDLAAAARHCPRDCSHAADAPDCALDEAVRGELPDGPALQPERVESFRRLLAARSGDDTG